MFFGIGFELRVRLILQRNIFMELNKGLEKLNYRIARDPKNPILWYGKGNLLERGYNRTGEKDLLKEAIKCWMEAYLLSGEYLYQHSSEQ
jgi:hypothetical protein